jgi:hypothetical protein
MSFEKFGSRIPPEIRGKYKKLLQRLAGKVTQRIG